MYNNPVCFIKTPGLGRIFDDQTLKSKYLYFYDGTPFVQEMISEVSDPFVSLHRHTPFSLSSLPKDLHHKLHSKVPVHPTEVRPTYALSKSLLVRSTVLSYTLFRFPTPGESRRTTKPVTSFRTRLSEIRFLVFPGRVGGGTDSRTFSSRVLWGSRTLRLPRYNGSSWTHLGRTPRWK